MAKHAGIVVTLLCCRLSWRVRTSSHYLDSDWHIIHYLTPSTRPINISTIYARVLVDTTGKGEFLMKSSIMKDHKLHSVLLVTLNNRLCLVIPTINCEGGNRAQQIVVGSQVFVAGAVC
jgi:hypothetical protein